MLTSKLLNAERAKTYFDHEKEYYTKNLTNYDRWHGALAKTIGLTGEIKKAQFDALVDEIKQKTGRKNVAFDMTFSVPKSVSLIMAIDKVTKQAIIAAHQKAISEIIKMVEMELLETRSNKQRFKSRNAIAAEFTHFLARPTEKNDFVADLDLHSHVLFLNATYADGKFLAQDFSNILNERMYKRIGVKYRAALAKYLQQAGFEIELTDAKKGFFELRNFPRNIIDRYSNRKREAEEYMMDHDVPHHIENINSRSTKSKSSKSLEEIEQATRRDLFEGDNKINIIRKEVDQDAKTQKRRSLGERREEKRLIGLEKVVERREYGTQLAGVGGNYVSFRGKSDIADFGRVGRQSIAELESIDSVQNLSNCDLAPSTQGSGVLLSGVALDRLAMEQAGNLRHVYLLRKAEAGRNGQIDSIVKSVVGELEKQSFAFKLDTAIDRCLCAGVAEGVTETEIRRALDRAGVVNAGHRVEKEATRQHKKSWKHPQADIYITTKKNLEVEKSIIDMFRSGQNSIKEGVLTREQSKALLHSIEDEMIADGRTDFRINDGEQGEAIHALLSSTDDIVIWQGWAGTGKTTACERLKLVCDQAGIKVRGISFTNKAALGLQNESGIPSSSIHSLLNKAEKGALDENDLIKNEKIDGKNAETFFTKEQTAVDKAKIFADAIAENFVEALNNGHGSLNKYVPERTMPQKIRRSLKEIIADAFLTPQDAAEYRAKLREEDRKLYFAQQKGAPIPKGADSKPLTGADIRRDVLFDAIRDNITDALGISKPEPKHHIPVRSISGKIGRSMKEILAEAFLDSVSAAKYRAKLEQEDEELYQYQQESMNPEKQKASYYISKSRDSRQSEPQEQSKVKNEWDLTNVQKADEPEIYVMDEAGLTDMHLFKQIQDYCHRRGAKLCLLGDTGQLIPVGAGMPMKLLQDEGATTRYLTDIRRQKQKALLDVAKILADEKKTVSSAFDYFRGNGLSFCGNKEADKLKNSIEHSPQKIKAASLMEPLRVKSHSERRDWNEKIRDILVERGEIEQGIKFSITDKYDIAHGGGDRYFAKGDRIQFLESFKSGETQADAGTIATIEKINGQEIMVNFENGKIGVINMNEFNSIDHAYAMKSIMYEMTLPRERQAQAVLEVTEATMLKDYKSTLLLVDQNEQRRKYNSAIRNVYVQRGELDKGTEFEITDPTQAKDEGKSKRNFAVGDRVIFTKKDAQKKIQNNLLGTIESIDAKKNEITVKTDMDDVGTVTINMRQYNNIDYAYAFTEYKAQGVTIDKAVVVMDTKNSHNRNDLYVGVTRARYEAVIVTDDIDKLETQSSRFATKEASRDYENLQSIDISDVKDEELYHYLDDQDAQLERALEQIKKHTVIKSLQQQEIEARIDKRKQWSEELGLDPYSMNRIHLWKESQEKSVKQAFGKTSKKSPVALSFEEWKETFPPPRKLAERFDFDPGYDTKRYHDDYLNKFNAEATLKAEELKKSKPAHNPTILTH